MRNQVIKSILENKIIAIVRGANVEQAVLTAEAVFKGGIKLIEVTFNQKNKDSFCDTVSAIRAIRENFPEMIVGAGTVLSLEQVDLALSAGAKYIVSPDTDEEVIKYSVSKGLVTLPGAYTASEVKRAYNAGADFVKLDVNNINNAPSVITDKQTPIFVYCYSGSRSARATSALKAMGYANVKNIGGISGWRGKIER